ncbi:sporulation histidine kinase inhibitor Sda [Aquibacillus salsiterrae]|uniref:Sporulation histidine kinase inhibitor Sda n=1 Tax=Aquibacillus salsiterrae TaxID=2950439 RepID=A0A9X3WHG1_9BACI|nr:sporulation histidine kinase inhibitor Sda [Aquibacillus salsiterrae]MDC3418515.1 sporulation histidine kinase inhibitor Sda [Aquibacillus salsiterrae]
MFENLSNQKLIDAYKKAIELHLEQDFIKLLEEELKERGIEVTE